MLPITGNFTGRQARQRLLIVLLVVVSVLVVASESTRRPPNKGHKDEEENSSIKKEESPCDLPPKQEGDGKGGLCLAYAETWSYDKDAGKCVFWIYGGCGGNANRFRSKSVCEKTCLNSDATSTPTPKPNSGSPSGKSKCNRRLSRNMRVCRIGGPFIYLFDKSTNKCKGFPPCPNFFKNPNLFSSESDCERTCLSASGVSSTSTTQLPKEEEEDEDEDEEDD